MLHGLHQNMVNLAAGAVVIKFIDGVADRSHLDESGARPDHGQYF
jgi:hypothetical protein